MELCEPEESDPDGSWRYANYYDTSYSVKMPLNLPYVGGHIP